MNDIDNEVLYQQTIADLRIEREVEDIEYASKGEVTPEYIYALRDKEDEMLSSNLRGFY